MIKKRLTINGVSRTVFCEADEMLADVLRKRLMLTGCKVGCRQGQCGACSIILDGKVVRSCITKMSRVADDAVIETIEGLGSADDLHPLQVAWMAHGCAQCGFCSPGFIMSAKGLLEENPAPTREEVRDWFNKHRNLCRCTGYKPLVDAVMDAAKVMRGEMKKEDLLFKQADNNSIVGSKYVRPSAVAKVTGTWDFGADMILQMPEDTLHLALAQAEVPHAKIISIDTSEAEAMPGVVKVLTYKDVKGNNRISGLITFPTNKGDGNERPILNDEKIFQIGDAYAIVAADTEAHAQAAAKKVEIELEVLPAYMDALSAAAPDSIEIHPGTPNVYFETNCIKGEETAPIMDDPENVVVNMKGYSSRQPHLPLEPDVGFAYVDENGVLKIHSKSIGIHLHHGMICAGLGVEPDKCHLIQNHAGGTFGYKFSPTMEALLGVAAMATGKPVALNYSMYQTLIYTGKRSPVFIDVKLAADKEGNFLAFEGENYLDHGPYSEFGDLVTLRLSQFMGAGYDIKNIRNKSFTVCTNHQWGSAFRGYGGPQSALATEVAVDMMAAELGMDPWELRYKNIYRESKGSTTPTGCQPDVYCLETIMDEAKPLYEAAKARVAAKQKDGYKYGVGFAIGVYGSGLDGADSAEAYVELTPEGVTVFDSWEDHGQGADMGTLAMAHETLRQAGFKTEDIKLIMNDMAVTPNSGPAGGSRSNVVVGNAIRVGCEMLLKAMRKADGTYRTYDEMVAENIPTKYSGKWVASACTDCDLQTGQGKPFSCYMYGAFIPEVEVNLETGEVKIEKMTVVGDYGTIMNKLVVDGQIYGGVTQAMGLALSEDFEDYKKHNTLAGCGIPYPNDVPDDFELHYVQTPRPEGPYGASGCGEGPLCGPAPAILNAIYNATGARITRIPARPEVVKAALAELED